MSEITEAFDDLQASIVEFEGVLRTRFTAAAASVPLWPNKPDAREMLWFHKVDGKRVLQIQRPDGGFADLTKAALTERVQASTRLTDLCAALEEVSRLRVREVRLAAHLFREMSLRLADAE